MHSILNARAEYVTSDTNRITINEPGFIERGQSLYATAICGGKGKAMTILGNIPCKELDVNEDENTCNSITDCTWQNETNLFNVTIRSAFCSGYVNLTHYSLNDTTRSTYCYELNNESSCDVFRCVWLNQTTLAEQQVDLDDTGKLVTIWETIKFMASFRADIGLGTFSFIFSFLFFYVPLVMLVWALYMAIPILH